MHIGVVFPQIEIGADAGADPGLRRGGRGDRATRTSSPTTTCSAPTRPARRLERPVRRTPRLPRALGAVRLPGRGHPPLELVTGIVILPQRQTVLVAKQAAEVDVLTEGRLRLGRRRRLEPVEYEALGQRLRRPGPARRGADRGHAAALDRTGGRLRRHVAPGDGAGIAPMPIQRPIPIWLGVGSDVRALERVGRIADGWLPFGPPGPALQDRMAVVHDSAVAAGSRTRLARHGIAHRLRRR